MALYITNLYGMDSGTTQISTQRNVVKTAEKLGFTELGLYYYPIENDTESELRKYFDGITSAVFERDIVIFQASVWNNTKYDKRLFEVLRLQANIKIVVFIHDIIAMMAENTPKERLLKIIEVCNMADLVIVPSELMIIFLREKGLKVEKILVQSMWDLPFEEKLKRPEFRRKIFFLGFSGKCEFAESWKYDVPLHIVTADDYEISGQNIYLSAWKNTSELLMEYTKGGFGLVWEQTKLDDCYKYYQSYELATYLAAGIPVIVKRGFTREQVIWDQALGFVVDSTEEAVDIVKNITEERYQQLVDNVKNISFLVRGGFFTKKLLIDTINYLLLD